MDHIQVILPKIKYSVDNETKLFANTEVELFKSLRYKSIIGLTKIPSEQDIIKTDVRFCEHQTRKPFYTTPCQKKKPRIAEELRLRVTSSDDPASFDSGSDLLRTDGLPWSRPLFSSL